MKGKGGGPIIGEIQRFLLDMVLEDPALNNPADLEILLHFYRSWKDAGGTYVQSRFECGISVPGKLTMPVPT